MFGYYKEKRTGHVLGYWEMDEKPIDTLEYRFIQCSPNDKPDIYVPDIPIMYNAKNFLASCILDTDMSAILDKLDAKQEQRLTACLQNANFELLDTFIEQLLNSGIITQSDVDYFKNKLLVEANIKLGE